MIPSYHPTFSTTPPHTHKKKTPPPPQKKKKRQNPVLSPHNKKNTKQNTPPQKKKQREKNVVSSFPKQKNTCLDIANSSLLRWSEVNDGPESLSTTWQRKNRFWRIAGEFFGGIFTTKSNRFYITLYPIPSMYGIFTYIWLILMVNVGNYTMHGWYGYLYIYIYTL